MDDYGENVCVQEPRTLAEVGNGETLQEGISVRGETGAHPLGGSPRFGEKMRGRMSKALALRCPLSVLTFWLNKPHERKRKRTPHAIK